jgi:uncharacterized protein (DUF924 family)
LSTSRPFHGDLPGERGLLGGAAEEIGQPRSAGTDTPSVYISWPIAGPIAKRMIATVMDADTEALQKAAFLAWLALNDVLSDQRLQLSATRRAQIETSYAQLTSAILRFDPSLVA